MKSKIGVINETNTVSAISTYIRRVFIQNMYPEIGQFADIKGNSYHIQF
jgi:hypothetical protein